MRCGMRKVKLGEEAGGWPVAKTLKSKKLQRCHNVRFISYNPLTGVYHRNRILASFLCRVESVSIWLVDAVSEKDVATDEH